MHVELRNVRLFEKKLSMPFFYLLFKASGTSYNLNHILMWKIHNCHTLVFSADECVTFHDARHACQCIVCAWFILHCVRLQGSKIVETDSTCFNHSKAKIQEITRAHQAHAFTTSTCTNASIYRLVESYVGAMTFVTCYVDPMLFLQHDNNSYHSESESVLSDILFEHQQCQMECADDMSDGSDLCSRYRSSTWPCLSF